MVKEGRTTIGYPRSVAAATASSTVCTMTERADSPPHFSTTSLNCWRSSPFWMAGMFAPMSSTSYCSRTPASSRAMAALSAVWPPRVGSRASGGRSLAMIEVSTSVVIGSTYVASANSGSVMIVAGFEFTRTTRRPSSLSTRQACVPE